MDLLLESLRRDFPQLEFSEGKNPHWSPENSRITYAGDGTAESTWGLLHELGHALLNHAAYSTDVDLLYKEVLAWQQARVIAQRYDVKIAPDYVEDCLDTYRDWLNKRSTCPSCKTKTLAQTSTRYNCFNCGTGWQVTSARHHRPYRRRIEVTAI